MSVFGEDYSEYYMQWNLRVQDFMVPTGVERSSDMIARAKDRIGRLSPDLCGLLTLVEGDATNYAATTRCDVVVSLFRVVSYQTSNNALAGIFRCAR